jgi:hypothetical protein
MSHLTFGEIGYDFLGDLGEVPALDEVVCLQEDGS